MPLTLAQNPLGSKNKSQPCPWTEVEEGQDRGGLSRPKSGGSGRRRRGESGGGARGDRALPVCGLKRGWGWPEGCSPREQWAAATAGRGGGAPARGNGSGVVWELHQAMEKLARGLARVEEGREGELRGGAWAAAMGCRGGSGLVALGGGKRFGEHRWRPRKLSTGSFGREEGWRRGLRGEPVLRGNNGGGSSGRARAGSQLGLK